VLHKTLLLLLHLPLQAQGALTQQSTNMSLMAQLPLEIAI